MSKNVNKYEWVWVWMSMILGPVRELPKSLSIAWSSLYMTSMSATGELVVKFFSLFWESPKQGILNLAYVLNWPPKTPNINHSSLVEIYSNETTRHLLPMAPCVLWSQLLTSWSHNCLPSRTPRRESFHPRPAVWWPEVYTESNPTCVMSVIHGISEHQRFRIL